MQKSQGGCGVWGKGKNQSERLREEVSVATLDTRVLSLSLRGEWQLEDEALLGVRGGESVDHAWTTGLFLSSRHKAPPAFRPQSPAWTPACSAPPRDALLAPSHPLFSSCSFPGRVSPPPPLPLRCSARAPEGPEHSVIFLSKY